MWKTSGVFHVLTDISLNDGDQTPFFAIRYILG
jgi:hypothetical protein